MHLKAGKLNVFFDQGSLRFIKFGDLEILNRIYFAVRDANWDTPKQIVKNVKTQASEDSFQITFDCLCQEEDIDFRWKCAISGKQDMLTFDIRGLAHSDFRKNRIGFCVLHPLNCKDRKVTITHTSGSQTDNWFPYHISPHQPFMDIAAMRWAIGGVDCKVTFEGDIFETEDQRNWSDASFKTYCTPLDLPFPVHMQPGDEVHQNVKLHITGTPDLLPASMTGQYRLETSDSTYPVPSIGLETNESPLGTWAVEQLKSLNLSHLRVEARTHGKNWQQGFEQRLLQVKKLGLPVELIIFLQEDYHKNLVAIKKLVEGQQIAIKCILPINTKQKSTSEEFIQAVIPDIKACFTGAPVGGGTDCYFTEFNRFRPPFQLVDFVSFSTNPQVHAFDDTSLFETITTLPDILETARYLAGNLPVYVSPVTLKPRFNPNATTEAPDDNQAPAMADHRHNTVFNALWATGCLKQLAQSGAELVTFFQTVGKEGVLMPDNPSAAGHQLFPVFELFKALGEFRGGKVVHTTSSRPMAFEGILLEKDIRRSVLLTNFTEKGLAVKLEGEVYTLKPQTLTRFNL